MPAPGPVLILAGLVHPPPPTAVVPPEALLRLWCDAVHVVVQRHLLPGLGDRQHDLLYSRALVRFVCRERGENARLTPPSRRLRLRHPQASVDVADVQPERGVHGRHLRVQPGLCRRRHHLHSSVLKPKNRLRAGLLRHATLTMRASHTHMQSASGAMCADPTLCAWAAPAVARPATPASLTTARRASVRAGRRQGVGRAKMHPHSLKGWRLGTGATRAVRAHCDGAAGDAVDGWLPRHAGVRQHGWPDLRLVVFSRPLLVERKLRHVAGCPDLLLLPPNVPVDGEREPERNPAQHQHPGVPVLLAARRGMPARGHQTGAAFSGAHPKFGLGRAAFYACDPTCMADSQATSVAPNICLTSASFVSADTGGGCSTSQFLIGFVDDSSWYALGSMQTLQRVVRAHTTSADFRCDGRPDRSVSRTSTLTWNQAQGLTTQSSFGFSSTTLSAYLYDNFRPPSPGRVFPWANRVSSLDCVGIRPKAADLDKITANIRANNGRVRQSGTRDALARNSPTHATRHWLCFLAAVVLHQALVQHEQRGLRWVRLR